MDYSFSEKQEMMKAAARDFLARECPLKLVRQVEASVEGFPVALWKKLADLGWPGLLIPEEYGGSSGSLLDLMVILEEAGRALLPAPLSPNMAGALAVLWGGSQDLKQMILPQIACGEAIITIVVTEPKAEGISLQAIRDGEGFRITGSKGFVPDALTAQYIVCAVNIRNSPAGVSLLVVDAGGAGVMRRPLKTISGARLYEVAFDGVHVPASRLLGGTGDEKILIDKVFRHTAAAECAWMLGAARRVFEMAVEYVKTREQYGHPIAAFQTVQHQCADMAVDLRGAEYVTYQAGWKLSKLPESAWEISIAKAWINEACRRIASRACYLHGALGYSEEYDAQLYLRRIIGAVSAFGGTPHHLEIVAQKLLA